MGKKQEGGKLGEFRAIEQPTSFERRCGIFVNSPELKEDALRSAWQGRNQMVLDGNGAAIHFRVLWVAVQGEASRHHAKRRAIIAVRSPSAHLAAAPEQDDGSHPCSERLDARVSQRPVPRELLVEETSSPTPTPTPKFSSSAPLGDGRSSKCSFARALPRTTLLLSNIHSSSS